MGIYNKFLDFIGIEEEPSDKDELVADETQEQSEPQSERHGARPPQKKKEPRLQGGGDTMPMPNMAGMKMIVFHPVSYEDAQSIIDNLLAKKPVIVNMEEIEVNCAQRILDFISGAVYALHGTICKISRGIFVITPQGCAVVGGGSDDEYEDL